MIRSRFLSVLLTGVLVAAGAMAQGKRRGADDADQKELYDYVLTMDKLQRFAGVEKSLEDLAKQHSDVKDESNAKTLDEVAQKLQKYPDAVALLKKAGFTPRDYALCAMSILQTGMAVGMKKAGTYKEYPPDMLKLVSKANLDFVEQHWDLIQKITNSQSSDK